MLSPAAIARYVTARRTDQLLEAVIANGQYLPVVIKVWLCALGSTPALSLGLKRVVELSRRPTPAQDMLAQSLLAAQAEDGSFDHDPLATAMAAAAFFHLLHDHHTHSPEISQAHQNALHWLANRQDAQGLFYTDAGLDEERQLIFTAYILQLLARDTKARQILGLDDVLHGLSQQLVGRSCETQCDRDAMSFVRIARAGLPRTPAVAAA